MMMDLIVTNKERSSLASFCSLRTSIMQTESETGISVAIRIRPLNQRELRNGETEPALVHEHQSILVRSNPPNQFNFGISK
jgi:hypothetical protein